MSKPVVVFVLGGPGSGKGTQCAMAETFLDFKHISAGECLREEWAAPGSQYGEIIEKCMVDGTIVPVSITCSLLRAKMEKLGLQGGKFLIDGFPRNIENLEGWEKVIGDSVDVKFCLLLDCPEHVMEERLLFRAKTSGRVDDDSGIIRKRLQTYIKETTPVLMAFQKRNKCRVVDACQSIEDVWAAVRRTFEDFCGDDEGADDLDGEDDDEEEEEEEEEDEVNRLEAGGQALSSPCRGGGISPGQKPICMGE